MGRGMAGPNCTERPLVDGEPDLSASAVAVRGSPEKANRGCLGVLLFAGYEMTAIRRAVVGIVGESLLEGVETLDLDGNDGRPALLNVLRTCDGGRPHGINVLEAHLPGATPGRP